MGKNKTKKVAPKDASLSDKRRFAAMISWEKRRKGVGTNPSAPIGNVAGTQRKSSVAVALISPVSAIAGLLPLTKRHKTEAKTALDIRRNAAKLGWEKRKRTLALTDDNSGSSNVDDASSAVSETSIENASNDKKNTAIKHRKKDALAIRIDAAKRGRERGRNHLAAESSVESTDLEGPGRSPVAKTASRKVYTASDRAKAAKLGWEKRKASSGLISTSHFATSVVASAPPPALPHLTTQFKNHHEGTKRSRRLAEESAGSYDDEVKKMNQVVRYLRVSRGWMEFCPSSRCGNGTATYGYIPSSIASFIHNGTISQRTVIDHGTLGVHYALDWDGYGGLKAMIATFGEDYSPYPTEEMMEQSCITDEWELGEDLPWREMLEAEDQMAVMIAARAEESIAIDKDILFVASILANLDHSSVKECEQNDLGLGKYGEEGPSAALSSSRHSSGEFNNFEREDCKTQEVEHHFTSMAHDVSHCIDQSKSPAKIAQQVFRHWHFGLC